MLTPTSTNFSNIKIDYKRIELLRRAAHNKTIRVTPAVLKKLDEHDSVDDFITKPSTSTGSGKELRRTKRKMEEDKPQPVDEKCVHCGCKMLRVVDCGRPDQRNVVECMRANCLASVKLTELPAGTVIGKEVNSRNKSVYNSLARYYPKNRFTPTPENPTNEFEDQEQRGARGKQDTLFDSTPRGIFISVPGQDSKARMY